MRDRIAYFQLQQIKYGILPLCAAQKIFLEREEYENCAAIKIILTSIHAQFPNVIFCLFDPQKSIDQLKEMYSEEFYDFGLSGEIAAKNFYYYLDEIIKNAPIEKITTPKTDEK